MSVENQQHSSHQNVAINEGNANKSASGQSIQLKNERPEAKQNAQLKKIANKGAKAEETKQLKAIIGATPPDDPIQRKENNTGLPDGLKSGIENLGGVSLDDVKVHRNSDKPAQLNAHAYAQGSDIHLGPGQEKHLPHEAWHVVQQKQGRVKPTTQLKGKVNINDDPGLEKEADVMGAKAYSSGLNSASSIQKKADNLLAAYRVVQREVTYDEDGNPVVSADPVKAAIDDYEAAITGAKYVDAVAKPSYPSVLDGLIKLAQGVGGIVGMAIDAVPQKKLAKELIFPGKARMMAYFTFKTAEYTAGKIPFVGMVVAPLASVFASAATGKKWKKSIMDAGIAEAVAIGDTALGTITGGIYTSVTAIAGAVGAVKDLYGWWSDCMGFEDDLVAYMERAKSSMSEADNNMEFDLQGPREAGDVSKKQQKRIKGLKKKAAERVKWLDRQFAKQDSRRKGLGEMKAWITDKIDWAAGLVEKVKSKFQTLDESIDSEIEQGTIPEDATIELDEVPPSDIESPEVEVPAEEGTLKVT